MAETHHRASGPVIARFREGLENVQAAELDAALRELPELDDRSRQEIEQFADRLVAKMLHPPLESLRDESRNGSPTACWKRCSDCSSSKTRMTE